MGIVEGDARWLVVIVALVDFVVGALAGSFGGAPFTWSPDKPQYVVMLMTNVDPVYVTESKNAFDRYNRENFYGKNYEIDKQSLSDTTKMMVPGLFFG